MALYLYGCISIIQELFIAELCHSAFLLEIMKNAEFWAAFICKLAKIQLVFLPSHPAKYCLCS